MSGITTIRGRVIRILSKTSIIVNLGSDNGVTAETVFRIVGDPEKVTDPVTGEELGLLSVVKARVKASRVYERFTIATSKWTNVSASLEPYLTLLGQPQRVLSPKSEEVGADLAVDPDEIVPLTGRPPTPVRIGDAVEATLRPSENLGP